MALKFSTTLRNALCDAITTAAGSGAKIRIYGNSSGARPTDCQTAIVSQPMLAELTGNATFAPAASGGVLTLNAITQAASAPLTGTALFFRVFKADGTTVVYDGDVATTGADLNLNTTSIVAGGPVQISSFTITAPGA